MKNSIILTEIMTPDMANFGGNIHGGAILKILDRVAYACSARYSGHYTVTLAVNEVLFKKPVKVGELVHFKASINYTGHSSMEVGIRVEAENLESGESRHTNTCYFTMIAVDENHQPTAVPPFIPQNEEERRRLEEAKARIAKIKST